MRLLGRDITRATTRSSRRRRVSTVAATAVGTVNILVLAGGVASAAWGSSGTGTAASKALTFQTLTVQNGTVTGQLYPGGSGDAVLSVTNSNPFAVKITQIAQDTSTGKFVSSDQGAACTDASGSTHPTGVTLATATGSPIATVGANATATVTLTGKVSMSASSDTGCQGATFTIPVTVTATS